MFNILFFTGGLGNYTPSKLSITNCFELGVSRSTAHQQLTPPKEFKLGLSSHEEQHLRPADEAETVTWSAESAPDLLF